MDLKARKTTPKPPDYTNGIVIYLCYNMYSSFQRFFFFPAYMRDFDFDFLLVDVGTICLLKFCKLWVDEHVKWRGSMLVINFVAN